MRTVATIALMVVTVVGCGGQRATMLVYNESGNDQVIMRVSWPDRIETRFVDIGEVRFAYIDSSIPGSVEVLRYPECSTIGPIGPIRSTSTALTIASDGQLELHEETPRDTDGLVLAPLTEACASQ